MCVGRTLELFTANPSCLSQRQKEEPLAELCLVLRRNAHPDLSYRLARKVGHLLWPSLSGPLPRSFGPFYQGRAREAKWDPAQGQGRRQVVATLRATAPECGGENRGA
jgi:hypothetical protein